MVGGHIGMVNSIRTLKIRIKNKLLHYYDRFYYVLNNITESEGGGKGGCTTTKILKWKYIPHFEFVQKFMVVCLQKCCRRPRRKTVCVYIIYVNKYTWQRVTENVH